MIKASYRKIIFTLGLFVITQASQAQRFSLFSPEAKREFPSVVYDFLETYLFKMDSLQRKGENIEQRLRDDKVFFLTGSVASSHKINTGMPFEVKKSDNKFYEVSWTDSIGNTILDVAFPMQYELILGKSKVEIEKEFKATMSKYENYFPSPYAIPGLVKTEDGCLMTNPVSHYYVESVNTATYFTVSQTGDTIPTFEEKDKWHSAANLFHGLLKDVADYKLYIEQNMYGFQKMQYTVPLKQWLAYCQAMKLNIYFAVEEEREDGLKALLIAQSPDLGFNHMLSIIIPDNFVNNKKSVFKATLNAYIPIQNVKDLYQKYVEKPKKKI